MFGEEHLLAAEGGEREVGDAEVAVGGDAGLSGAHGGLLGEIRSRDRTVAGSRDEAYGRCG